MRYHINHNGMTKSLRQWAKEYGIPYPTVKYRWQKGDRDFEDLFAPEMHRKKLLLPEWAVKWLRETKYARSGMANEWDIACELIGLPSTRADELRELLEGKI